MLITLDVPHDLGMRRHPFKQELTTSETEQWRQYEYLEHLVRIAKGQVLLKLHNK